MVLEHYLAATALLLSSRTGDAMVFAGVKTESSVAGIMGRLILRVDNSKVSHGRPSSLLTHYFMDDL